MAAMLRAHDASTLGDGGFSLIELISVIVIAGVLAVMVVPQFLDRSAFDERGFYDEVASAARYAQKLAITSGCEVQFAVAANAYVLNQRATSCTAGAFTLNVVHPGGKSGSFDGSAPAGIALSMTGSPVVFNAAGSTTDSIDRTVNVGARSFQIVGATGFVLAP